MTAVEEAVAHLLPNLPPRDPDAPGQFAFADADRVRDVLVSSKWKQIEISPTDFVCTMPTSGLNTYLTNLGPVGRAIDQTDEPVRQKIVELGRSALEPYVMGSEVRLTAACWTIRARR